MSKLVVVALAGALLVCGPSGTNEPRPGEIAVEWPGGSFRALASAVLCIETGLVELVAVRGDSGLGMALFPADSTALTAGIYPVFAPTSPVESRPGAGGAIRWFRDGVTLGYQAIDGMVRIESSAGGASGSFEFGMHQYDGADSLRVTGRFRAVPVDSLPTGCGATSRRHLI